MLPCAVVLTILLSIIEYQSDSVLDDHFGKQYTMIATDAAEGYVDDLGFTQMHGALAFAFPPTISLNKIGNEYIVTLKSPYDERIWRFIPNVVKEVVAYSGAIVKISMTVDRNQYMLTWTRSDGLAAEMKVTFTDHLVIARSFVHGSDNEITAAFVNVKTFREISNVERRKHMHKTAPWYKFAPVEKLGQNYANNLHTKSSVEHQVQAKAAVTKRTDVTSNAMRSTRRMQMNEEY